MRIYPQRGTYLEQPTIIEIISHTPSSRVSSIQQDTPDGVLLTQAPSLWRVHDDHELSAGFSGLRDPMSLMNLVE
jgi:hypothetical protein